MNLKRASVQKLLEKSTFNKIPVMLVRKKSKSNTGSWVLYLVFGRRKLVIAGNGLIASGRPYCFIDRTLYSLTDNSRNFVAADICKGVASIGFGFGFAEVRLNSISIHNGFGISFSFIQRASITVHPRVKAWSRLVEEACIVDNGQCYEMNLLPIRSAIF